MNLNPMRCTLASGAVLALAILGSPTASAAPPADPAVADTAIVVAQASAPALIELRSSAEQYPAYQRGVRKAAAESNEALRRYVWRTRMIYNFYYNDFVSRE